MTTVNPKQRTLKYGYTLSYRVHQTYREISQVGNNSLGEDFTIVSSVDLETNLHIGDAFRCFRCNLECSSKRLLVPTLYSHNHTCKKSG